MVHEQHRNATSIAITQVVGNSDYNWVDLFTRSPNGHAYNVDQKLLQRFILGQTPGAKTTALVCWSRVLPLIRRENKLNKKAVIWCAGTTVHFATD